MAANTVVKRRFRDEMDAIFAQALSTTELDRLRAEGGRLTEAEAISIAFPTGR